MMISFIDKLVMKLFFNKLTTSTQLAILFPRALNSIDLSPRLKTVIQAVTYLIIGFLPTIISGSLDSKITPI
ncbi:MAG: hypothetical protein QXQ33_05755 [Nitrososphaerota archaeon]